MTSFRDVEDLYRFYDERYTGAYMSSYAPITIDQVRDVLSTIPASGIESILDYGCGRGFWTPVLEEMFPSARIVGIDISARAIERARSAFPQSEFATFDGHRAPYADEMFGLVFSYHVLEHVLDLGATIDDIARLVAPDGWACVMLPCGNPGSFEYKIAQHAQAFEESATGELRFCFEDHGHLRRPRTDRLVILFQQKGLRLMSAAFCNQFWGTIEYLVQSDRDFIRALTTTRGIGKGHRSLPLMLLRAVVMALSLISRAHRVAMVGPVSAVSGRRAVVARLIRPVRPLLSPIVSLVESRARGEWQTRRTDPRGSAQFLVFRRA